MRVAKLVPCPNTSQIFKVNEEFEIAIIEAVVIIAISIFFAAAFIAMSCLIAVAVVTAFAELNLLDVVVIAVVALLVTVRNAVQHLKHVSRYHVLNCLPIWLYSINPTKLTPAENIGHRA